MLVARLDDAGARWNGGVRLARSAAKRLVSRAGYADQASAEALEPRLLLALVEWDGGAGTDSWHDALNWSGDEVPTAVDDVVIGETELGEIRLIGSAAARSLTTSENVVVRGTLSVTEGVVLNARMTLGEGPVGSGRLQFNTTPNQAIQGQGEILFDYWGSGGDSSVLGNYGVDLTIGEGITIHGSRGTVRTAWGTLINEGVIRSDGIGERVLVYSDFTLVNRGRFEALFGELSAAASFVYLAEGSSHFAAAGAVLGFGGRVDLQGRTWQLDASTGDVHFGGELVSGAIASADGARMIVRGSTSGGSWTNFVDVRIAGDVQVKDLGELRVFGDLRLEGRIILGDGGTGAGWGKLVFPTESGAQLVHGGGQIVFNHHANRFTNAEASVIIRSGVGLTIDESITIRGGGGDVRVMGGATVRVDASLVSDVAGKFVALWAMASTSQLVVNGPLMASAGELHIGAMATNAMATVGETTSVTSGDGVVVLGRVDLTGRTLTVNGELALAGGGRLLGGMIVAGSAGGRVTLGGLFAGAAATLQGVHVGVPINVFNDGTLYIEDGLRLDATLTIGVGNPTRLGHVWFRTNGEQALLGDADVLFGASSGYSTLGAAGATVSIASGITVRGGAGRLMTSGGGSITSFGAVDAAVAGTTIRLEGNVTHHGAIRIAAGARIERIGAWTFQPGSRLEVEIGGTTNALIGRFTATGPIVAGGSMDVRYINGYEPPRGSSIRYVTSAGASGEFSSIITPPLSDPDLKSPVLIDAQGVRLIVTHIADFNNDLSVNEADIVAFLTDWFAGGGDFDGDGERTVSDIFVYLSAWHRA